MELLPFKASQDFSMGVELEFQIINPSSCNLISKAKELVRNVRDTEFETRIKPEITQSMLEINSSIHSTPQTLLKEFMEIRSFLLAQAEQLNIHFCGGGTHPFQKWISRKIFPTPRFREISRRYKYLAKRSTVFGLHTHIGCSSKESALYLTHILARFVPQLIAISAGSPFYEGVDTGYNSTRVTIFNTYPLCGTIPYLTDWQAFSDYFYKMKNLGIVESMKDFYWDIRPKPEFGTVEIRICDTPLTFQKAVMIAAYIQALSYYILREKILPISEETYALHNYNRFQAARYGLEGSFINPYTHKRYQIIEDINTTIDIIKPSAEYLGTMDFILELQANIMNEKNDAALLREIFNHRGSMKDVVREQCRLWAL